MKKKLLVIFSIILSLISFNIFAVQSWIYINEDGKKIISNLPPSPNIPRENILKEGRLPLSIKKEEANINKINEGDSSNESVFMKYEEEKIVETPAEKRKRLEEERKTAEQSKKEEAELQKWQFENCNAAKRTLSDIQAGILMKHKNSKGENVFMTKEDRETTIERAKKIINNDCKK